MYAKSTRTVTGRNSVPVCRFLFALLCPSIRLHNLSAAAPSTSSGDRHICSASLCSLVVVRVGCHPDIPSPGTASWAPAKASGGLLTWEQYMPLGLLVGYGGCKPPLRAAFNKLRRMSLIGAFCSPLYRSTALPLSAFIYITLLILRRIILNP